MIRIESRVARAGAGLGLAVAVWAQLAGGRVEGINHQLVQAQIGDDSIAIVGGDDARVRVSGFLAPGIRPVPVVFNEVAYLA